MADHLSDDWFEEACAGLRASQLDPVVEPPGWEIHVRVGGPDDPTTEYRIVFCGETVSLEGSASIEGAAGAADQRPSVRFDVDPDTAREIAAGQLSAQRAFMSGSLRVTGDVGLLIEHAAALGELSPLSAQPERQPLAAGAMPELPEVRAHAERLTETFAGAELTGFRALSFTALKTATPDPKLAVGETLSEVVTRGKVLLLRFPSVTFAVHLMQGGRLVADAKLSPKPRGGLARWTFAAPPALLMTEAGTEHKAGVWVLSPDDPGGGPLAELGPDADAIDEAQLESILTAASGSRLHGVLRDQRRLAGLGRRLANEICWAAQLSPFAAAGKLSEAERRRLHEAMCSTIEASLADERSRSEMVKSAQRLAQVHHRAGQPCSRCGDTLRQVEYRAYEVDYCPTCQTGGKVLADNTTSKFLK